MDDHPIIVAVRLRPPLDDEAVITDEILKFNTSDKTVAAKSSLSSYDCVFDQKSSNKNIYEEIIKDKIKNLIDGYNVTILAYGSTGSGKTHTMGTSTRSAENEDPGLIPLGLKDIFETIDPLFKEFKIAITASFFEIYLEEVKDLLNSSNTNLVIRGEAQDLKIVNLTEIAVGSVKDALNILEKGSNARHTDSTAKNVLSSRSHAIFCINMTLVDKSTGHSTKSKFQLVDLAGSERTKTSKTEGQQFKQGLAINKALSTLGRVINSIFQKDKHIPYRDSSLTRILQDSFGGNSYTVMIACISPVLSSLEESISTLRYASQARCIKNKPIINKDPKEALIEKLKKQINDYEVQLLKYRKEDMISVLPVENDSDTTGVNKKLDVKMSIPPGLMNQFIEEIVSGVEENFNFDPLQTDLLKKKIMNLLEVSTTSPDLSLVTPNTSLTEISEELLMSKTNDEVKNKDELLQLQILNLDKSLKDKEDDLINQLILSEVLSGSQIDNINQALMEKINVLQKEKEILLEKFDKENNEKIKKLEKTIEVLEEQLKKKQNYHEFKIGNLDKEQKLKSEIQALKKSKVDLIKRFKDETKILKKKEIEGSKKIIALEKQHRKNEVQWKKKESSLESRLRILQKKVADSQMSQKKTSVPDTKKKIQPEEKKCSKDIVTTVNQLVSQVILLEKSKSEVDFYEKEAKALSDQIEKKDIVSDEERKAKEIDQQSIIALTKTIKDIKNNFTSDELNLDFITTLDEASIALKVLFQQIKISQNEKWTAVYSQQKLIEENAALIEEMKELKKRKLEEVQVEEIIKEEVQMEEIVKEEGEEKEKKSDMSDTVFNYLDEAEESFASTSDLTDPDWRATPLHKRNLKRKVTETAPPDEDVTPAKKRTHGCRCPSNCTSIRCACRKKNHTCGMFCGCDKKMCKNIKKSEN